MKKNFFFFFSFLLLSLSEENIALLRIHNKIKALIITKFGKNLTLFWQEFPISNFYKNVYVCWGPVTSVSYESYFFFLHCDHKKNTKKKKKTMIIFLSEIAKYHKFSSIGNATKRLRISTATLIQSTWWYFVAILLIELHITAFYYKK